MFRKLLLTSLVCLFTSMGAFAQTGTLTGEVTDSKTGETIVGANVFIPEAQSGSPTDADGNYEITGIDPGSYTVRITYIGYKKVTQSVDITAGNNTLNVQMDPGVQLGEVVVEGALGIEQTKNAVTFSSQSVDNEDLNIAQPTNVKNSLAGKVAGLQISGQAGSKLGEAGDVRIRGALSLTSTTSEPLYVIDGVPGVDPNTVDMNNVSNVNVLKGPNATALYGQRGQSGVIIMTTKGGTDKSGVSVEINESLTFDKVAYLPEYQNSYGQGYAGQGEWQTFSYTPGADPEYFKPMDGVDYLLNSYADESWGPKLDGHKYGAWYNWFPDSPYYGEESTFTPQSDNVKNFYDTGTTNKLNLAVNKAGENYSARFSYTNLSQKGIIPGSELKKHLLQTKVDYDATDALNIKVDVSYSLSNIDGNFSDGYSGANMTSGSFNQWFGRQLDISKLRELQDLKTPEGYQTNWNWWGPVSALGPRYGSSIFEDGFKKPAFWFNPYKWQNDQSVKQNDNNLLANVQLTYDFTDNLKFNARASRTTNQDDYRRELPFGFQKSSDQTGSLYNNWVNSFGQRKIDRLENNYNARLSYTNDFEDISVEVTAGSEFRDQSYDYFGAFMDRQNYQSGGLFIPDVYQYGNARSTVVPNENNWNKQVFSMFGRANIGYKDMLYLNGSYRQDYSSALPNDNNGYGYPSVGASFVFTDLVDSDILSYGKVRVGWAQVGSDVAAERILSNYALSSDPYVNPVTGKGIAKLYTDATKVDPSTLKPSLNSSYEAGLELGFLNDRIALNATYYNETKEDEIIGTDVSTATGKTSNIINAGETKRRGVELQLDVTPVSTNNFRWTTTLNWAKNKTTVESLPGDKEAYTVGNTTSAFGFVNIKQVVGQEYGQLSGNAIARNDEGQPTFQLDANGDATGNYVVEKNHNFGSYLPDFTGGWVNNFVYKGIGLQAAIDYQKGGQFFSLSQQWGASGGLLDETAGTNDKGNLKRDPVSQGGGTHIEGVDSNGNTIDTYVNTKTYYKQFSDNYVADPYVMGADYIKLRSLSLSYNLPKEWIGSFVNSARVSFVARNVWMIAVAPDNNDNWDPSEMARDFGEDGQLPGTRSFGFNVNLTF